MRTKFSQKRSEEKNTNKGTMNGLREPSREEQRVMDLRRERNDRISRLMGEYLLKGYRMLADSCPDCGNVLLQTHQGQNYCVACEEVDEIRTEADPGPESPMPEVELSSSQLIREIPLQESLDFNLQADPRASNARKQKIHDAFKKNAGLQKISCSGKDSVSKEAIEALEEKIRWSTQLLKSENNFTVAAQLADLIRACAEARKALDY